MKGTAIRPYRTSDWTDEMYLAKMKGRSTVTASGCWEMGGHRWQSRAWKGGSGYGQMAYRGKNLRANRLAYILTRGPIPAGMVARHTCNNQCCCNPDHIVIGTQKDNIADCIKAGNQQFHPSHHTHCPRGHAYADDGRFTKQGWRACVICQRACRRRAAGWPEDKVWMPAQSKSFRPDFTMNRGGVK